MGMDLWNSGLPFGTMGLLRDDRGCRQVDFGLGHVGPAWLPGCETSLLLQCAGVPAARTTER